MRETIDVPVIEAYDSIMQRYGEAQAKVLASVANQSLAQEGLSVPELPKSSDYRRASSELSKKGLKLMAAIVVLKPWKDKETQDEHVDQIVFCDVVPGTLTELEYRDAILRTQRYIDPKKAQFNICDFSKAEAPTA